jgi:hypothetical protein
VRSEAGLAPTHISGVGVLDTGVSEQRAEHPRAARRRPVGRSAAVDWKSSGLAGTSNDASL